MVNIRKTFLATGQVYHVYNRGVERRPTFMNSRQFRRAVETINFYRFSQLPIRYSHYLNLSEERKRDILNSLEKTIVQIIAYCLMPNHFHFLLRQEEEKGISVFVSNFTNSYSKYFNIKNNRVGPLFQGSFKAVLVQSDEQLLHLTRYIHLNPTSSFLVSEEKLDDYPWSSFPEYLGKTERSISDHREILENFKDKEAYKDFVHDQIDYLQQLKQIEHVAFDEN